MRALTSRGVFASLLALCLGTSACAPSAAPTPEPVGVIRQAGGTLTPVVTGSTVTTHLGVSLAPCGVDVVAGSLDGTSWRSGALAPPLAPSAVSVGCRFELVFVPLAGGPTAATRTLNVGTWGPFGNISPVQLVTNRAGTLIAQRTAAGTVTVMLPNATAFPLTWTGRIGLVWDLDDQTLIGVGASDLQRATITTMGASDGTPILLPTGLVPAGPAAIGVFGPYGVAMIALTDTQHTVWVLNRGDGSPVLRLANPTGASSTTFGAALAVETDVYTGLDGLFVGDPANDMVLEFVGDAGVTQWIGPTGSSTGASIAHVRNIGRDLFVGGPEAQGGRGAVYRENTPGNFVRLGELTECTVGPPCIYPGLACSHGDCVGGVVCTAPTLGCPNGFTCVNGVDCVRDPTPDAGPDEPDAGDGGGAVPVDAGLPDAAVLLDGGVVDDGGITVDDGGVPARDAGATDGGGPRDAGDGSSVVGPVKTDEPYEFATGCTCAGLDAPALVVLGLAALRRRRR